MPDEALGSQGSAQEGRAVFSRAGLERSVIPQPAPLKSNKNGCISSPGAGLEEHSQKNDYRLAPAPEEEAVGRRGMESRCARTERAESRAAASEGWHPEDEAAVSNGMASLERRGLLFF